MLHVTPGQATECEPVGHVLHVHVVQPSEPTARPFAHVRLGQLAGAQTPHEGACHAHFPSVPRRHIAETIGPPSQFGSA